MYTGITNSSNSPTCSTFMSFHIRTQLTPTTHTHLSMHTLVYSLSTQHYHLDTLQPCCTPITISQYTIVFRSCLCLTHHTLPTTLFTPCPSPPPPKPCATMPDLPSMSAFQTHSYHDKMIYYLQGRILAIILKNLPAFAFTQITTTKLLSKPPQNPCEGCRITTTM